VFPAPNDPIFINLYFVRHAKGDNLIAYTNNKPWKIFNVAVGPFEIDVFKGSVFACGADVLLNSRKRATHCAVNSVARNDDAPFEAEAFAQRPLPQTNGFGVVDRGKRIEKDDFGGIDTENVSEIEVMNSGAEVSAHD
jgi:hypothetical protein